MMLLIYIILISAAAPSNSRAVVRPLISVSSNWGEVLEGDNVTLTCNVDSASGGYRVQNYKWYKDSRWIDKEWPSFTIQSAQSGDGGRYTCELKESSDGSDPLLLEVHDDLVILQSPPTIFEDDSPTLRCRHREGYTALNTTFYKDSLLIKWSETDSELHFTHVNRSASDVYSCSKLIQQTPLDQIYTDVEYISVRELFSNPDIKVSPYPLTAGDAVTLTCETRLAPLRAHTVLQFAFYRNGQKLQEFGKSKKYRVKSAELYHSGDYTCDVRTSSGNVQKTSRPTNIKIKGAASRPVISLTPNWGKILTGESVTLTCNTDATDQTHQRYYWYKDSQFIHGKGKTFTVTSAETHDSGDYRCQTHRGGLSDPIKLDVSSEVFILQAPPLVYEEDFLWMRCHYREGYSTRSVTFYKGGEYIGHSLTDSDLQIRNITISAAGTYKCKSDDNQEDSAYISVAGIFSDPEIKVSPYPLTEGTVVTMTCDTSVALLKADTKLRFAFYRDTWEWSKPGESNTYSAKYNSGWYNCKAQTSAGSVTRTSKYVNTKFERADRPDISVSPNTGKIYRGNSITLTCNLDQNEKYSWLKGSQYMASHDKTIVILSADKEDSGDYQCKTSNSYKSDPFTLEVSDGAAVRPVISAAPNTSRIFTGDSVTLICNVDSMDEGYQAYYWYKGPDYIYITGKRFTVHSAELDDGGDYRCCTDNSDRSDPFTLGVSDVPVPVSDARINTDRGDLEMVAGDNVTFTCSVEQGSSPSFLWRHNGQEVDDQSGLYQITESGKMLYIESVSSHHGGTYQCQASNQISPNRTFTAESNVLTISVSVPVSDARIRADREDLEMVAGDNVTFTCSVERGSSPSFLWWHNGQEVDDQSGLYQITESGKTLYIESVSSHHGGTYQCRASNQFSPGRTFTAESNMLTISVSEKTFGHQALLISVILLVLVLVLFILIFTYRHKLRLLFIKTHQTDSSSHSADNSSVSYVKCRSAEDKTEDLNQGISGSRLNTFENFNSI